MKKANLTLMSLLLFSIGVFSQSPKMVLVEHFTQASCGPCAAYNPSLQAMLDDSQNAGRLTSIKYQTSWPGVDPMNSHNPGDVQTRVSYYGVTGVPNPVLGGNAYNGTGFDQSHIDTLKDDSSSFEINLSHEFDENSYEIIVKMKIKTTQTTIGNLRAHIAVVENEINFNSAPGTNGERDFYHVMKKMLPGSSGTPLSDTMLIGDSIEITSSWVLSNIYDYNQIAVVGFIQDNNDKHVHQAAYSAPFTFTPNYNVSIQPLEVTGIAEANCNGKISPIITFRNAGANGVTSASFDYSVNGGAVSTYNWTGLLDFNEEETVELDEISFNLNSTNEVIIYPNEVNSTTDEYLIGDTISFQFNETSPVNPVLKMKMMTGSNADLTVWKIIDSQGNIVAENGEYENSTLYKRDIYIKSDDCFQVHFDHDDGYRSFSGFFELKDVNNEPILVLSGGSSVVGNAMFTVDPSSLGVEKINESTFTLFPNPSSGEVNITSNYGGKAKLIDLTGKTISEFDVTIGTQKLATDLEQGIYFFKMEGEKSVVKKININ